MKILTTIFIAILVISLLIFGYLFFQFKKVTPIEDIKGKLSDGMRPICKGLVKKFTLSIGLHEDGGAWGFEDEKGKMIIDTQYSYVSMFKEGRAMVIAMDQHRRATTRGGGMTFGCVGESKFYAECGVIDKNNNKIVDLIYHNICAKGHIFIGTLNSKELDPKSKRPISNSYYLHNWAGVKLSEEAYIDKAKVTANILYATQSNGTIDSFDIETASFLGSSAPTN